MSASVLTAVIATPALAATRVLLVAVSDYPDVDMRLEGPTNDARLLYQVLRQRGVPEPDIRVLADGIKPDNPEGIVVTGPPTRQAIVEGFDRLAAEAAPGDEVFISMSGHGTQQPARDPRTEADGLDEVFLPLDVGRWDEGIASIDNALVDDDIGQMLDRIRRKGAKIWFAMDSCHSGTGTRGAANDPEVWQRSVSPESLGVPAARMQAARASEPSTEAVDLDSAPGLVAFFAAQSNEAALELKLPARQPGGERHGLLSYYIAQALARSGSGTYLGLAQSVRAGYDEVGGARQRFPTPLFEGDLTESVLGDTAADAVTRWPARRIDDEHVRVDAGRLHGLRDGSELLLRDATGAPAARGAVTLLGLAQSDIALSWIGSALPDQLMAEAVGTAAPEPYLVDVPAQPPAGLAAALATLQQLDAGNSGITLAEGSTFADLQLRVARDAVWLVPQGDNVNSVIAAGASGIPLELPAQQLAAELDDALRARAATHRLAQLAETFASTPATQALEVDLAVLPRGTEPTAANPHPDCSEPAADAAADAVAVDLGSVPHLRHCDTLFVTLRNRGADPLDIGLFYVDSLGAAVALPGLTALRLDAGEKVPPLVLPFTITTWDTEADRQASTGIERLVVTGLKRADKADRAFTLDFATILGLAPRTEQIGGGDHRFLDLLAADQATPTRGAAKGDPRDDAFITTAYWQTMPL